MTAIAACTDGRTVWMAADSASTDESGRVWTVDKLCRLKVGRHGTAVVAGAGDHRLVQLCRSLSAPVDPDPTSDDDCDGWAQAIAEAWTQLACEAQPPVTGDDGLVDGYALLGYAGRIWVVMTNVADRVHDGYAALGTGGDLALGVLAGADRPGRAEVVRAVEVACRYNARCAPPVRTVEAGWPGAAGDEL